MSSTENLFQHSYFSNLDADQEPNLFNLILFVSTIPVVMRVVAHYMFFIRPSSVVLVFWMDFLADYLLTESLSHNNTSEFIS